MKKSFHLARLIVFGLVVLMVLGCELIQSNMEVNLTILGDENTEISKDKLIVENGLSCSEIIEQLSPYVKAKKGFIIYSWTFQYSNSDKLIINFWPELFIEDYKIDEGVIYSDLVISVSSLKSDVINFEVDENMSILGENKFECPKKYFSYDSWSKEKVINYILKNRIRIDEGYFFTHYEEKNEKLYFYSQNENIVKITVKLNINESNIIMLSSVDTLEFEKGVTLGEIKNDILGLIEVDEEAYIFNWTDLSYGNIDDSYKFEKNTIIEPYSRYKPILITFLGDENVIFNDENTLLVERGSYFGDIEDEVVDLIEFKNHNSISSIHFDNASGQEIASSYSFYTPKTVYIKTAYQEISIRLKGDDNTFVDKSYGGGYGGSYSKDVWKYATWGEIKEEFASHITAQKPYCDPVVFYRDSFPEKIPIEDNYRFKYGETVYAFSNREKIKITVYGDKNIEVSSPSTIDIFKGSTLSEVNSKFCELLKFKKGYSLKKWKLKTDESINLWQTLDSSYEFIDNSSVYADSNNEYLLQESDIQLSTDKKTLVKLLNNDISPKIVIPNYVEYIKKDAFSDFDNIHYISILPSLKNIEDNFVELDLKGVSVDSNNNFYSSEDGILFDKTKTKLFYGRTNRSYADLSKFTNLITICKKAFNNSNLSAELYLPNSLENIEDFAFANTKLREIRIPSNLKNIGEGAFAYCSYLKNFYVEASNKNFVSEDNVLFNKDKSILIKKGITQSYLIPSNGEGVRYDIPDTVTCIKSYAFSRCNDIKIYIPSSVTSIEVNAFEDRSESPIPEKNVKIYIPSGNLVLRNLVESSGTLFPILEY